MTPVPAAPARRKRGPKRGTLLLIAGLLVASALVRFGDGVGQAVARARAASDVADSHEDGPAACPVPEDLQVMLTAFQDRDARLAEREAALEERMLALSIADEEVTRKLAALGRAEQELRETIALADSAAEDDLGRLTQVYENMKPKQAAALFEEMDPSFAAGFLARMRPEAAAAVMAGLSPKAAHTFSVMLAGRNASVPVE